MTSPASTSPRFAASPTDLKSMITGVKSGMRSAQASAALVHLPGIAIRFAWRSFTSRIGEDSGTTRVGP